jgi:hypothetical protein
VTSRGMRLPCDDLNGAEQPRGGHWAPHELGDHNLAAGGLCERVPATIVVFILLLTTTRAKVNAAAFLIAWSVSLAVVFSVSYVVGGTHGAQHDGGYRSRLRLEAADDPSDQFATRTVIPGLVLWWPPEL